MANLKVSDSGFEIYKKRKYVITDDNELTIVAVAYGKTESDAEVTANRILAMNDMYGALKAIQREGMLKLASNFTECGVLEMVEKALLKADGKPKLLKAIRRRDDDLS
jgi:hypothetical protein